MVAALLAPVESMTEEAEGLGEEILKVRGAFLLVARELETAFILVAAQIQFSSSGIM